MKKATSKGAQKTQTKSEFILEHPNLPAKEIVAKAKAAGFALTEKYVYTIRSVARSRQARAELKASVGAAGGPKSGADALLIAVAAEVGLARAIGMLEAERSRVLTMLK